MGAGQGLRLAAAGLACAAVGSAGAFSPPVAAADGGAASESEVAARSVTRTAAEVREYWTAARMRDAIPAGVGPLSVSRRARERAGRRDAEPAFVEPAAPGAAPRARLRAGSTSALRASEPPGASDGYPNRVHGKVFLTLGGEDYVCSGTVVRSFSHALVWTAGHCVNGSDIGLGFATNWMFVPGYRDGARPYGSWVATKLLTTEGWRDHANVRVDVGAAVLARDGQGRGIEDVVGARGIAFNQPRTQVFDTYGYPAVDLLPLVPPDFNGERLWACHSPRIADDNPSGGAGPQTMEIDCDMTAGSSGGGWVIDDAFVNSVTSYTYQFDFNHLYGPYMGGDAEALYTTASGPELLCGTREVTNLGTGGPDRFDGTGGRDSFLLRSGADQARAAGGPDRACGGGGPDRLDGGGGDDGLEGGGGADLLIGGPGRDVCDGGPGRDRARGCERKIRIP